MFRKYKSATLFSALMASGLVAFAQDGAEASGGVTSQDLIMLLIWVMIVIALVTLMLAITLLYLVRSQIPVKEGEVKTPWWKRFNQSLTDVVPIEEEETITLDHNYDGIRELDNNLPPWWKWGFYLTIFIGVIYMWHWHVSEIKVLSVLTGPAVSSQKAYWADMEEADKAKQEYLAKAANLVNENNVTLLTDATAMASGRKVYMELCVACHGTQGEGGIGPNLTDEYWLHGGSISNVFSTVKYGVVEKGMISWADQLSPKEMHEVSSYILSMQGTSPEGGKEPQGELYVPEEEAAPADTTEVAMN